MIFMSSRLHPDGQGSVRDLYEEIGTAAAQGMSFVQKGPPWPRDEKEVPTVLNGIDVLVREEFARLRGLRIGLITNQTGVDRQGRRNIDLMRAAKVNLVTLFAPEHGIAGAVETNDIADAVDQPSGLPVRSLYGNGRTRVTARRTRPAGSARSSWSSSVLAPFS